MTKIFVLALLDFNKQFIIETNASKIGVSAVLIQETIPCPILASHWGQRQHDLSIYKTEMLTILYAVVK